MFISYVLLRHLLYVENRSKTGYFSNIHTPGITWYLKMHHHIKTNYQYNIMQHTLTFLKNNYFYFRYLLKIKLTEQGFCLFFTVVSKTFPQSDDGLWLGMKVTKWLTRIWDDVMHSFSDSCLQAYSEDGNKMQWETKTKISAVSRWP